MLRVHVPCVHFAECSAINVMQAHGVNAVRNGRNIVVATSTASGKSLCYNVPVLEELTNNSNACALYLFPTKV